MVAAAFKKWRKHRGFSPAQVLAEARRLGFHSVRGNHDDKALAAYEALARGHRVPSKRDWVRDMPPAAAQWLRGLPFSIRVPSYGLTIVHAGIVPDVRLLPLIPMPRLVVWVF